MQKRLWVRSGIVEELDAKQVRQMEMVLEKIKYYYKELYGSRPIYKQPLNLSRLMILTKRSGATLIRVIHLLANTVDAGSNQAPNIHYDRLASEKNPSHRAYRIYLRK